MSDHEALDEIRTAVEAVLEHARNDETYRGTLLADPVATLTAAGLPATAAAHVGTHEFGSHDEDASGFATSSCDPWTCVVTICSNVPFTGHTGCGALTLKPTGPVGCPLFSWKI